MSKTPQQIFNELGTVAFTVSLNDIGRIGKEGLNTRLVSGRPLLHEVLYRGTQIDLALFGTILDYGADPVLKDADYHYPIFYAIEQNWPVNYFELLLASGASYLEADRAGIPLELLYAKATNSDLPEAIRRNAIDIIGYINRNQELYGVIPENTLRLFEGILVSLGATPATEYEAEHAGGGAAEEVGGEYHNNDNTGNHTAAADGDGEEAEGGHGHHDYGNLENPYAAYVAAGAEHADAAAAGGAGAAEGYDAYDVPNAAGGAGAIDDEAYVPTGDVGIVLGIYKAYRDKSITIDETISDLFRAAESGYNINVAIFTDGGTILHDVLKRNDPNMEAFVNSLLNDINPLILDNNGYNVLSYALSKPWSVLEPILNHIGNLNGDFCSREVGSITHLEHLINVAYKQNPASTKAINAKANLQMVMSDAERYHLDIVEVLELIGTAEAEATANVYADTVAHGGAGVATLGLMAGAEEAEIDF